MAYVQTVTCKTGNRYRMFWRSPDPKTGQLKLRSKDFSGTGNKVDALKEARLLEAADTRRPLSTEGNGTIADFLASWTPTAVQGLEPASAYNIKWAVRKVSLWVGDLQLSKFSALTLVNIQRQAANDGLEPVTIRRILRTFKKAVREAVAWQLLPPDAITALDNAPVIRVKKKQPALRTIEESHRLADALRAMHPAIADMVIVAALTGMRYGEIAALSWEQINLTRNKLQIDRTLSKGEGSAYRVKMSPKTEAGNRTIPLAPEVVEVLDARRRASDLIFPSRVNRPILGGSAAAPVRKAAQKLNVAQGFHSSRHYWASLMISRNVPLPTVSYLLGHSSPRVTMEEYAWCISDPSENDAVLEALSGPISTTPQAVRRLS